MGILGAGPAGLLLSQLLAQHGIDSVVLESRARAHVESRVRAGVLEQGTVETLEAAGAGERLRREGLTHDGIVLRFENANHIVDCAELTGRRITVYGQQEVVRDLIALRLDAGGSVLFGAEATALIDLDTDRPQIAFTHDGQDHVLECDVIAGCDGFHGIARRAIPDLVVHERVYPFAWLGILAEAPPASDLVVYARHEDGFALLSMRTPSISRLYLQCAPDEDLSAWPDTRIWDALDVRLSDTGLCRGPIIQKGVTPMRSFVAETMRHGRLFLAGDSAHIVPPTGAKGMNLAIADVRLLASALAAWFIDGHDGPMASYSATALERIWKVQRFSWMVTSMMHRFPNEDSFDRQMQLAQLRYTTGSRAAATTFAENYTGLPY